MTTITPVFENQIIIIKFKLIITITKICFVIITKYENTKKQLLIVFLLIIALCVFVLRPSIYPLTVYEFKKVKKNDGEKKSKENGKDCSMKKILYKT